MMCYYTAYKWVALCWAYHGQITYHNKYMPTMAPTPISFLLCACQSPSICNVTALCNPPVLPIVLTQCCACIED